MTFSLLFLWQASLPVGLIRKPIVFAFLMVTFQWLLGSTLVACPNEYYTYTIEGEQLTYDFYGQKKFMLNFDRKREFQKLLAIEDSFQKHKNYRYATDWASTLLKLGQYQEALKILVWLNQKFPDHYEVLVNLGTAYELNGNLDSALKYIGRGIALNPKSHKGSEWIHLKALEFQKEGKHNPTLIGLLNLSEEDQRDSVKMFQIRYQLLERMPFSPAPNEVVARLLIDYASCVARQNSMEVAIAFLKMAKVHYKYANPQIDNMISSYKKEIMEFEEEFNRSGKVNPHSDTTLPFEFSYNWAGNLDYKDFYKTFAVFNPDWSEKKLTSSMIMEVIGPQLVLSHSELLSATDSTFGPNSLHSSLGAERKNHFWPLIGIFSAFIFLLLGLGYFYSRKSDK